MGRPQPEIIEKKPFLKRKLELSMGGISQSPRTVAPDTRRNKKEPLYKRLEREYQSNQVQFEQDRVKAKIQERKRFVNSIDLEAIREKAKNYQRPPRKKHNSNIGESPIFKQYYL